MKTIVINTSKEAVETKLDILFKTPCDRNSLIWLETELKDIQNVPPLIRQALVDNTDIVDRDYNLIVLVDLYRLPRGNDSGFASVYKPLIARYIGMNVVCKLYSDQGLIPAATSIYFADSSTESAWYTYTEFEAQNAEEQRKKQNREALEAEEKQGSMTDGEDGLVDVFDAADPRASKKSKRAQRQKFIMELFGWTEEMTKNDISWILPIDAGKEKVLDFGSVFMLENTSITSRPDGYSVVDSAISAVEKLISETAEVNGDSKNGCFVSFLSNSATIEYSTNCITHHFERDNEQTVIEGFFNIFANIFTCVQKKRISQQFKLYSGEKIKQMLLSALKKYEYFSDEDNITLEFEPIAKIYEIKDEIFKARRSASQIANKNKDKTPYEVADEIMAETVSEKTTAVTEKMRGLDREFHSLVESIFNNYDTELIKKQNGRIVKECLTGLWNWRDKQTCDDFRQTVDATLKRASGEGGKTKSNVRETVAFIEAEYEREYSQLINEVTEAEHRLSANKNILLETKDLVLKYGDLMRKGKWYLVSFIGALIAIAVSVLPYIYVEYYVGTDNLVFKVMYLLFTAGFACLYGISAAIYTSKIVSKKRKRKDDLEQLKLKSESERRESIAALYKYYSETVVKTENHCLLWREILRRDRENSKKGIKRNNHIKRLEFLIGEVKRFMTMLKLDYEDDACRVTDEDIKRYTEEGLYLDAEESFHSATNQKIYSVLSEDNSADKND